MSEEDEALIDWHSFWAEGVALCAVAVVGFAANLLSAYILSRGDVR